MIFDWETVPRSFYPLVSRSPCLPVSYFMAGFLIEWRRALSMEHRNEKHRFVSLAADKVTRRNGDKGKFPSIPLSPCLLVSLSHT